MISAGQWRKELANGLSDSELGRVRLSTHTGRPLGSDSFLSKLEKLLGRRVRSLPVRRPRKEKVSNRMARRDRQQMYCTSRVNPHFSPDAAGSS